MLANVFNTNSQFSQFSDVIQSLRYFRYLKVFWGTCRYFEVVLGTLRSWVPVAKCSTYSDLISVLSCFSCTPRTHLYHVHYLEILLFSIVPSFVSLFIILKRWKNIQCGGFHNNQFGESSNWHLLWIIKQSRVVSDSQFSDEPVSTLDCHQIANADTEKLWSVRKGFVGISRSSAE